MDYLVDWDCRFFPELRGKFKSTQEVLEAFEIACENFGITRFCLMPEFHPLLESPSMFLLNRWMYAEETASKLPPKIKVLVGARVRLVPELHKTERLHKFLITKEKYLPIVLPTQYEDWIDLELNRLLYQSGYQRLLFMGFERCILNYPQEALERLVRISHAVFQLSYEALCDPTCSDFAVSLLRQNKTILPGTSLDSLQKVQQYDFNGCLTTIKAALSESDLQTILRGARNFWRR